MGLMAVYQPNLPHGEVWEKLLEFSDPSTLTGDRGKLIQIPMPGAKIQAFPGGSIIIFCSNLEALRRSKVWVNERLGTPDNPTPLGDLVNIKILGARPAYYKSLREVEWMLERVRYPLDIQPDEFKDFVKRVFGIYCEGEDITISPLIQVTGFNAEKVERLLGFASELGFTHMKPITYQLEKIWRIGSTPEEDQRMRCESFESTGGAILFELGRGVLRILRGPLPEIRGICERIGPLVTCPKCNLLMPFPHGARGCCPNCDNPYFRDPLGELVEEDGELLKAEEIQRAEDENSAPSKPQPSITIQIA